MKYAGMEFVEEEEFLHKTKLIKKKCKCANYGTDIFVELKSRGRTGKCFGAGKIESSEMESSAQSAPYYNVISADIWYHVIEHIRPEDVHAFALICRETAALVRARKFWKHLYKKYCQKCATSKEWILRLPDRLQYDSICKCDARSFRYRVIEALFNCHDPFVKRLQHGYTLDALLGHIYVSSWFKQYQCIWIMCYKFRNQNSMSVTKNYTSKLYPLTPTTEVVNDWESLANDRYTSALPQTNAIRTQEQEGVCLLVIMCDRFLPFPAQLLYGSTESRVRLQSSRQMLSKDMRRSHLELDFVDGNSRVTTTVKYPHILKYKVLPWWHPDFRKFIK